MSTDVLIKIQKPHSCNWIAKYYLNPSKPKIKPHLKSIAEIDKKKLCKIYRNCNLLYQILVFYLFFYQNKHLRTLITIFYNINLYCIKYLR